MAPLEHDPEKWVPVFGKDHAPAIWMTFRTKVILLWSPASEGSIIERRPPFANFISKPQRHAMLEWTTPGNLSLALRQFSKGLVLGIVVFCQNASHAQEAVDIGEYFTRAQDARGAGLARKSKPVDVRPAKPDEVIVTMIKGEGKETQSPPAKSGDMVVRNRCPETGNEQILVPAASFLQRYEGPIGAADADGWSPYRPRGVEMRFVAVPEQDGSFNFIAPWGEKMVARPGDLILQDLKNSKDTYRIAKAAFACTYEVLQEPQR